MSFKDYQKAKKTSTSPTENGIPGKLEDKKYTSSASVKLEKDSLRKEHDRTRETASHRDNKAHEPRVNGELDRYAQVSKGIVVAMKMALADIFKFQI